MHQLLGRFWISGAAEPNVESAEALVERADAQYRLTVLTAFNEVRDALYNYDISQQRVEAVNHQLEAVERAQELAVLMHEARASQHAGKARR